MGARLLLVAMSVMLIIKSIINQMQQSHNQLSNKECNKATQ